MRNKWWAKFLRVIGIVFMSLASVFTLAGGAGTSCVALNPTGYEGKFAGIAPFQWLWILFVLVGVAAGIMGVRAVVMLVKGKRKAYFATLIALVVSIVLNLIHVIASRALRGGSMPVDGVLYMNVITLVIFLLFHIPGIWQGVNFEKPEGGNDTGKQAGPIAMGAVGLFALTIQFMMAPTHTIGGINYADVWHVTLTALGLLLIAGGILLGVVTQFAPLARRSSAHQEQ